MKAIVIGAWPVTNVGGQIADGLKQDGWEVVRPLVDRLDVTRPKEVEAFDFEADALVYSAGHVWPHWIEHQTGKSIHLQVDVNLTGAIHCLSRFAAAGPGGVTGRYRRVVIIGSAAAFTPHRGQVAYNAAKAGLRAVVTTAARELHGRGFRVFLIEPGAISGTHYADNAQEGARRMFPGHDVSGLAERGTFGANLVPADIARLAVPILNGQFDRLAGYPIPYSGGPQ